MAHHSRTADNWKITLALPLSIVGAGISLYQSQQYYQMRNGMGGFHSICNIGESMNCDAVMASRYAEFIGGFPLSSFAAGWLLALFFVTLFVRNPFWRRDAVRLGFAMSVVGMILSVIYFFIMHTILQTYCLFCLIVDGINIALFGIFLSLKPEGLTRAPLDRKKLKTLGGTALAALAVTILGLKTLDQDQGITTDMQLTIDSVLTSAPLPVTVEPQYPSFGPANAPLTIVEFSDFQCPYCRFGAIMMERLLERFPTQIRVVFRNMPLDQNCNPQVNHRMHDFACEAAKAASCAHKVGKFKPVYLALFEDQQRFAAPGKVVEVVSQQGLDASALKACMEDPQTGLILAKDIEEARVLNVQSTPTLYLNGRPLKQLLPFPAMVKLIETALQRKI